MHQLHLRMGLSQQGGGLSPERAPAVFDNRLKN
jgi:hypothetical protein